MADSTIIVKLVSPFGTGYYKTTRRPLKMRTGEPASPLKLRKYDPVVRKHGEFKEVKKLK